MAGGADLYRLIFERSHDLIAVTDVGGTALEISPNCREILGWEPEEIVGRSWVALIHPDDRAAADRRLATAGAGQSTAQAVRRVRHRSGRFVTLEGGTF